jgi:peptide/nickel transport system ATP-binding protein
VLLVADEPVSMLDMSVRAKILELMLYLRDQLNLTYLYITHDLATAKFFCDRIAILYLGRVVEIGPSEAIYADPKHPYTRALLRAIPDPDPRRTVPRDLPPGEVPDAARPPLGCSFHPRCSLAFEVCGWETRDLRDLLETRWALQEPARYEAEQAVMGDLTVLDEPGSHVRLAPGSGHTATELLALLDTIREESPELPFWKGVKRIAADGEHVEVEFHDPIAPRPLPQGDTTVECHLYDDEALAEAERRRGETAPVPTAVPGVRLQPDA